MDRQKDSWNGSVASNQPPSSNIDPTLKVGTLIPPVQNQEGAESGQSTTAGFDAPTGQVSTGVEYSDEAPAQINITASTADQRPLRGTGAVKQDVPEAGQNQYQ